MADGAKPLGVVITPAEIQYEGLERVLDNLADAGVTDVCLTPGVVEPGRPGEGSREPPLDVDGRARILDRPLWGEQETWLKTYVPYPVDADAWRELGFPAPPRAPEHLADDVPRSLIDAGRARGLGIYLQISPYTLPGLPGGQTVGSGHGTGFASARPVRVDGTVPDRVLSGHGCLNNPRVRALGQLRMREVLSAYPDVDGVFVDWAEYTCYFLEDCFTCFCEHCRESAVENGLDWEGCRRDLGDRWDRLHRLDAADLRGSSLPWPLTTALDPEPTGWPDNDAADALMGFKADTVRRRCGELRSVIDEVAGADVSFGFNAFPPPWNRLTGSHYERLTDVVDVVRCKLFTFHWPMITRWWAESLLAWNPRLDAPTVLTALHPSGVRRELDAYHMPAPDEPHPIRLATLQAKLAQAVATSGPQCWAYVHSYRPVDEFAAVLDIARNSPTAGCWVQRYGYLSDAKLATLRDAWTS